MMLDPASAVQIAALAYFVWFLGWSGKHIHDAFLLLRLRDWYARLSTRTALARANRVLRQLEEEFRLASEVRFLILWTYCS